MDFDGKVRSVVWSAVFPSVLLVRTLRTSFRFSVISAALAGYILMVLGGWFIGVLYLDTEEPLIESWHEDLDITDWGRGTLAPFGGREAREPPPSPPNRRPEGVAGDALPAERVGTSSPPDVGELVDRAITAPVSSWWWLTAPVLRLFHPQASLTALSYLLLRSGWNVLVWAFFGGAIARIAAVDLTRRESIGVIDGFAHAAGQFPAQVLAPLLMAVAILLLALPLLVAGALIRVDVLAWIAGMIWLAVLVVGLLLAVVVVGAIAGWPLLWAAIAVERSDPFDAVSRAYAYVYQRPLYLFAYTVSAVVLIILGAGLFYLFAGATVILADWAIAWGSGAETMEALQGAGQDAGGPLSLQAASGRRFWLGFVAACMQAYPIGFLFTAAVAIYLLMRLQVDAAQVDEIAEDQQESLPGLPVLEPHPSGVPEMKRPY